MPEAPDPRLLGPEKREEVDKNNNRNTHKKDCRVHGGVPGSMGGENRAPVLGGGLADET